MGEPRTIFITGSTSGLGLAAAERLLSRGHRVILHARDSKRGQEVVTRLQAEMKRAPEFVVGDLGSLASVRAMADELIDRFDTLDVLINNAAISNWGRETREETVDGHERIFATNYLSHYLLARLLVPHLLQSSAPRVISVGARQMGAKLDFDDLQMQRNYDPMQAVLRAKVGMFSLTRVLAKRYASEGLRVASLDPGLAKTGYQSQANLIMKIALGVLGKSPERVATLYEWLATSEEVSPEGRLYAKPGKPTPWQAWVADDDNVDRVWRESAKLVNEPES